MYKVIEYFEDLTDERFPYHAGDPFPHEGMTVSKKRIKELSTKANRRGKPLIKEIPDDSRSETGKAKNTSRNRRNK